MDWGVGIKYMYVCSVCMQCACALHANLAENWNMKKKVGHHSVHYHVMDISVPQKV